MEPGVASGCVGHGRACPSDTSHVRTRSQRPQKICSLSSFSILLSRHTNKK